MLAGRTRRAVVIDAQTRREGAAASRAQGLSLPTVALFCPAILLQPDLLRHCLAIAIVLFALLELIRCFRLPPLAEHLDAFLSTFIDSRDSGTLILTHIYLLFGCGLPVWLAPAATTTTTSNTSEPPRRRSHAGVLVLGVGDAFASLVGVHFGRHKWPQSKKTFEGTAAAIVSMMALLALLLRHHEVNGVAWGWLLGCTMVACALEALTEQIDNLFLPVAYMACLLLAAAVPVDETCRFGTQSRRRSPPRIAGETTPKVAGNIKMTAMSLLLVSLPSLATLCVPHRAISPPRAVPHFFRRQSPRHHGHLSMSGSTAFQPEIIDLQPGSGVLVGALIKRDRYKTLANSWTIDDSLDELQRLCETAGLEVLDRQYQSMQNPSPSTFIGPGKLDEVAAKCKALRVKTLVFDDELSPAQGRNIAEALGDGAQVIDRTMLILFIFAQRARTREAKLQVAAAQYKYMLPRLTTFLSVGAGLDAKGGAVSGGGGQYLKGSGESQLEVDRRLFRKQLSRIEEQINEVQMQRDAYREKRKQRDMLPVVAIVGYTNAGKSTLLNALVGSKEVYADDLLFATLDPTTRKLCLPGGREVLISDTVGFIQKLPTKLVASFRATLDELQDAALVVHVVDASSPLASQQVKSVQGIIHDLDAHKTPQILVLNKADAVAADPEASQRARSTSWESLHEALTPSHVVATSAADGRGLDKLKAALEAALARPQLEDSMCPALL